MNFIPSLSVWDILILFEDMKLMGLIVDIAGSLTCIRDYSYGHKGVGHTNSESAQHF